MKNNPNHWRRWVPHLLVGGLAVVPVNGIAQQPQPPQQAQQPSPPNPARDSRGDRIATFREIHFVKTPEGKWTGPRLPDGQPDIQGFYSNTIGTHNNLTDPQAPSLNDKNPPPLGPRSERAESRVSDPPDGEVPFQAWARAKQLEYRKYYTNPIKPEYVDPFIRCSPGGPTRSFLYRGYEIRQYPGYVLFIFAAGSRTIHLDGKPHLPDNIKLWNADSRGHWEGNTLVVDVTNNNSKSRLGRTGEFVSENVHIQERYIFDNNGQRFTYVGVYTDPTVLTRPMTITIPNKRVTVTTAQDGWNNLTYLANNPGKPPSIEISERICVENNGAFGQGAVEAK